jgi:hypothetical protein
MTTCTTGHGSDAVADSRNEKARWAGTHRAVFVDPLSPFRWPNFLRPVQRNGVTFERCMDGIGILQDVP